MSTLNFTFSSEVDASAVPSPPTNSLSVPGDPPRATTPQTVTYDSPYCCSPAPPPENNSIHYVSYRLQRTSIPRLRQRATSHASHTVFRLQNSRMPIAASSRPNPDRLIPPKGSSWYEMVMP